MMEKTELNFYDTSNARHRGDDGSCDPPGNPFAQPRQIRLPDTQSNLNR